MNARTISDATLLTMTLDDINSGLRDAMAHTRYTHADALRFVELWNTHKLSTLASLVSDERGSQVFTVDAP